MSILFWPSVFLVLGLLLLIVEVFIPSGGFIGICSIVCLVLCLWYAFEQSLGLGVTFMVIDLVALPLTAGLAFSLWSRTPLGRRFLLKPPAPEEIEVSHADHHLESLVGQVGRTLTPLRPCGHVEIDGQRADALVEEGFLPAATTVRVLRVRSGQVVVRGLHDPAPDLREDPTRTSDLSGPEPDPSPHSHDRKGGLHPRGCSMSAMLFAQVNQPPSSWSSTIFYMLIFFIGLIALIFCIFLAKYFNLWIQAKMTQANVSIWDLVGMTFRKVNPNIIVRSKIMAYQAGLSEKDGVTTRALEAHYLAGGNVPNVVRALIAANRADIPLSYKRAAAIDLAGRNVLEAVQTSVNPKVIPCPDPTQGRLTIDGVAKNGIQLKVKAKVTVRTNLDRLVGGATDETIIARVGEGIVNAIGSADTHLMVLEKPDSISKRVLEKGLDAGTAYEILSIDIADIDVGDNVGANLQALQAEADMRVARAKAEERRAFAVAKEQEMLAHVQENRAKVVQAEAEVPMAIAEAFRMGNLGITDYYQLRNVQADTEMRNAIAGTGGNAARREPVVTP